MAEEVSESPELRQAHPWITFFIDILGWSAELRKYDDTINYRHDLARVSETIIKPIEKLELLRSVVESFDLRLRRGSRETSPKLRAQLAAMPSDARAVYEAGLSPAFKLHSYGDSFILNSPWMPDPVLEQALASTNVRTLFLQAAFTMGMELAVHVPLRGAIEIGIGTEYVPRGKMEPHLISASIAKAYVLEQKTANYLRVVIGPDLLTWLRRWAEHTGSSVLDNISRNSAQSVLGLCMKESDGTHSLDYLSPEIIGPNGLTDADTVAMAYTFVDHALALAKKEGRDRHVEIYAPALAYFEKRVGPLTRKMWPPGREPSA